MSTDPITVHEARNQIRAILARIEPDQDFALDKQRKAIANTIAARRAEYVDTVGRMEGAGENALYERGVAFGMDLAHGIALSTQVSR